MVSARRFAVAAMLIMVLVTVGCGDNDRPPQEAFVLQNDTDWNVFIVSGRLDVSRDSSLASGFGYSVRIDARESLRETYGRSPDGQPGACFGNSQKWVVRSLTDSLEHPGINDVVDVDDLEILAHFPSDTCFDEDDQLVVLTD